MKTKYVGGGFRLPVMVEYPKISGGCARVIDAKGRLIKRFASFTLARQLASRLNQKLEVFEDRRGKWVADRVNASTLALHREQAAFAAWTVENKHALRSLYGNFLADTKLTYAQWKAGGFCSYQKFLIQMWRETKHTKEQEPPNSHAKVRNREPKITTLKP